MTNISILDKLGAGEWSPSRDPSLTVYKALLRGDQFCYVVCKNPDLKSGDRISIDKLGEPKNVGSYLVYQQEALAPSFHRATGVFAQPKEMIHYQQDRRRSSCEPQMAF